MRRALVVLSVIAVSLLGAAFGTVGSALAASRFPVTIHLFLRTHGYFVAVDSGSRGKRLDLNVFRHGEVTIYSVRPRQHGDSVEASFGRLGSLDLSFQREPERRCHRLTETKGAFAGNFEFTGEHGYIHFDTHRVQGDVVATRGGCGNRPTARAAEARGVLDESETTTEPAATLTATAPGAPREFVRASAQHTARGFEGLAAAFRLERDGPVSIARGAEIRIGEEKFRWNLGRGTATLRPGAPFSGSAAFCRYCRGGPRWTGTLRVPTLGGPPLDLTGRRFGASLVEGAFFRL